MIKHGLSISPPFPRSFGPDFLFLGVACLTTSYVVAPDDWAAIVIYAVLGLLLAIYRIYQISRDKPDEVINNVFLTFTIAFVLYFLIGPLMQVFGNIDDLEFSRNFFEVTAPKATIVMGANIVGFGITLIVGRSLQYRSFANYAIRFSSQNTIHKIPRIELIIISVGLLFKLFVLYNDLFVGEVISGIYRIAQMLCPMGIFLYFRGSTFNLKPKSILVVTAVGIYSLCGLLEFNKTEIFLPFIAIIGGVFVRDLRFKRLTISLVMLVIALEIIQPFNLDARNEAISRTRPTVADRLDIYQNAFNGDYITTSARRAGIWARLDYTAPNIAAMWLYDNGNGGDSYKLIPWLFVPRLLYPDKPETTTAGTVFTDKLHGYNSSSTGVGLFISGYYDLGWFGLVLASVLSGIVLAWYRAVLVAAQVSKSTMLLVLGSLGHWTAFFVNGDYVASYVGTWVISFYLLVMIFIAQKVIYGRKIGI